MQHQLHLQVQEYLYIENPKYAHHGYLWSKGMVCGTIHESLQVYTMLLSTHKIMRRCRYNHIYTQGGTLPRGQNRWFLKQAALDIIFILTNPPSSIMINLEVGDIPKKALLKTAHVLQRITTISHLHNPTESSPTSSKQDTLVPWTTSSTR